MNRFRLAPLLWVICFACPAAADTPTGSEPLVGIDFSPGAPDAIVVQGDVKLHRRDVHAYLNLCRTAFDAPIPSDLDAGLQTELVRDFKSRGILGRQAWLKLLDAWPQIQADQEAGKADPTRADKAHAALQAFRIAIDKRLRNFPDARVHQLTARLLKRQSEVLMPGPPEVSSLAADVYLDVLVFVAALGRNEALRLTDGQRSVLRDRLRTIFRTKPTDDHKAVANLASSWTRVVKAWGTAPALTKMRVRSRAAMLLGKVAPPGKQIEVPETAAQSAAAFTPYAKAVRASQHKLDAIVALSVNPTHVWAVLRDGLALPAASK